MSCLILYCLLDFEFNGSHLDKIFWVAASKKFPCKTNIFFSKEQENLVRKGLKKLIVNNSKVLKL